MKKQILAGAVCSMVASMGYANATLYGIVDAGVGSLTTKGQDFKEHQYRGTSGKAAGSRFGLKADEELSGAVNAGAVIEFGYDVNEESGGLTNRQSIVYIEQAEMGRLSLGYQNTPMHDLLNATSPSGGMNVAGSIYGENVISHKVSEKFSINAYEDRLAGVHYSINPENTPVHVHAFYSQAHPSEHNTPKKYYGYALMLKNAGGFTGGYAYQVSPVDGATTVDGNIKQSYHHRVINHVFTAEYALGDVNPSITYTTNKDEDGRKYPRWQVGLRYAPAVKHTVFTSYMHGHVKNNVDPEGTTHTKGMQVGYTYDLSKRTSMYAVGGMQEAKNGDGKTKIKEYNIGLKHMF